MSSQSLGSRVGPLLFVAVLLPACPADDKGPGAQDTFTVPDLEALADAVEQDSDDAVDAGLPKPDAPQNDDVFEPNDTFDAHDAGPGTVSWDDAVDQFWGEAPDQETRLTIFDDLWETFAESYACFDSYDVDWDEQRAHYRPLVEQATSFGRFYQLMREMVDKLSDPHSPLLSDTVCKVPRYLRPPIFKNLSAIPIVGGCVTLDDQGELLVYRASPEEDNPLGLQPGDVILGFDGDSWEENLVTVDGWGLPECGEDFAAAPISDHRLRAAALPSNAHLFTTIEVRRYATGETETFDTELLLENISNYIVCGDQVPVEGADQPVADWLELDYDWCSNCVSHGVIPNTNIGFISVYGWYGGALSAFEAAVEALWDTDGLIIDQRFNLGGVVPFTNHGFPALLGQDIDPLVSFYVRESADDYFALVRSYDAVVNADESTYYDHPIAVLTGPKAGSAGDLCPYLLSHHPRARRFGRETMGAFGELAMVWYPKDPFIGDFSLKVTQAQMISADGMHLNASEQPPEEAVWLTADDVAGGVDTVFSAALEWIESVNAQ